MNYRAGMCWFRPTSGAYIIITAVSSTRIHATFYYGREPTRAVKRSVSIYVFEYAIKNCQLTVLPMFIGQMKAT